MCVCVCVRCSECTVTGELLGQEECLEFALRGCTFPPAHRGWQSNQLSTDWLTHSQYFLMHWNHRVYPMCQEADSALTWRARPLANHPAAAKQTHRQRERNSRPLCTYVHWAPSCSYTRSISILTDVCFGRGVEGESHLENTCSIRCPPGVQQIVLPCAHEPLPWLDDSELKTGT